MSRVALVTGCSSGIGRSLVTAFLEAGWSVVATLRDAEQRAALFDADRARHGDRLSLLTLDLSHPPDIERAAEFVRQRGGLDCLVNNAGYALFGALEDLGEAQLRRQLEVNLIGAALLSRALLPALRARGGRLFFVSSLFGYAGYPLSSAYCASKFALEGLAESLYHELRPQGVAVTLVQPGGHRTRFGDNVAWGDGSTPAYRGWTAAYRRLKERLSTRPGGRPPDRVAARVVALVGRRRPPLRARVGAGAHAIWLFQRWVPEGLRLALLGPMFRRLFGAEAR